MAKLTKKVLIVIVRIIAILILIGVLTYLIIYIRNSIKSQNKHEEDYETINEAKINNFEERSILKIDADLSVSDFNYTELNSTIYEEHPNFGIFDSKLCGLVQTLSRIEGGKVAKLGEFPWFVTLMSGGKSFCGGSLISEKLVLTAAHCLPRNMDIIVRLGEYNLTTNPDCGFDKNIQNEPICADPVQDFLPDDYTVVIHSKYDLTLAKNDIALIKLKKPANISQNNINFICLPFHIPKFNNSKMLLAGFGLHENSIGPADTSKVMLKGTVEVFDNEECKKKYGNAFDSRPLTESQFCAAGNNSDGKYVDSCKGDSGSPLMIASYIPYTERKKRDLTYADYEDKDYVYTDYPEPKKETIDNSTTSKTIAKVEKSRLAYFQLGIASYGEAKECGRGSRPGVYTNVQKYLKWILDNAKAT